jgi:serine/threonine-protein kinase PknG
VTACVRPGCSGTLDEAGYCQVCLERPAEEAGPRIPGGGTADAAGTSGAGTSGAWASATAGHAVAGTSRRASGDPWWGLDLIALPEIPAADPDQALQLQPSVPTSQRICGACGTRIGRTHDGQAALATGVCHHCGKPYSFIPKLQRDAMIADRYRISGCIGYGGLGWVFLAEDTHLNDQPVVLKGLIDPENRHTADAAERELKFLTEVDHPNIVRVRDFATQPTNGADHDEYIVMEYIPGYTVEHIAGQDNGLSAENVIAYCLHLLAAVDHLHSRDWLHCDIKPPNLMLAGTGVKLIDLGAGCRIGASKHTWGTEGYRAPEVTRTGPTLRSDLYSVGQTMKTMLRWTPDYREADTGDGEAGADTVSRVGHQPEDREEAGTGHGEGSPGSAPGPASGPAVESLDNFISRATAQNPADRFGAAVEMAGQLSGVLRELVALRTSRPHPGPALLFGAETECLDTALGSVPPLTWWTSEGAFRAAADGSGRPLPDSLPAAGEAAALLPAPRPDPADPAAGLLLTLSGGDASAADEQLAAAGPRSVEANLLRCRTRLARGDLAGARESLTRAKGIHGSGDWRIRWHDALIKLAAGRPLEAVDEFDAVYRALPGEVVPKLALGLCTEYLGETRAAERLYRMAWQADRTYVSTAFGLARTRIRLGDRAGAVAAADEVPDSSRHAAAARIAAFRLLTGQSGESDWPTETELGEAAERLERPPLTDADLGDERRCRLRALLLEARLRQACLAAAGRSPADVDKARETLEAGYRALAKYATGQSQHTILVDLANQVRGMTLD